jgi:hypothetical protein
MNEGRASVFAVTKKKISTRKQQHIIKRRTEPQTKRATTQQENGVRSTIGS